MAYFFHFTHLKGLITYGYQYKIIALSVFQDS